MANVDVTRIASNIGALNALNSLQSINAKLALHQTRLSTGKRINSAADDPAGLTIATKMLARSEGLKVALSTIGDAKNLLADALDRAARSEIAAYALLVDAKDVAASAFYRHHGFIAGHGFIPRFNGGQRADHRGQARRR